MNIFKPKYNHKLVFITNISIILCLSIICFSCSGSGRWAEEIEWSEIDINNLPDQDDYPESEAVILQNEGRIQIHNLTGSYFSTYDRHMVIKILNHRGHRYANVVIPYGQNSEVDNIEARTISSRGKITVLDPETVFDVNLYPNFVFYSDQRAKIFTLPAVEDECIIEYKYEMTIQSQTYGSFWKFQSTIPVELSRFTLIKPVEWELDYRLYNIEINPDKFQNSNSTNETIIWEARHLDPIQSEIGMPSLNELGARMALQPVGVNSWQDIARWYYNLVETQMSLDENIESTVDTLLFGVDNDIDKMKILFEWVRDQIRYVSVSIGVGGYQPHEVSDVIRNKYGDCKDMTTLLCAMAEYAGIEAHESLISTRLNGLPDTTLPAAVQFNHVIAYAPYIGSEGIWMDATEKTAAFGQLPWYDQGMPTLVVGAEGEGKLVTTPITTHEDNYSEMHWEVTLSDSGSARIRARTSAYGTVANELRENFYNASPKKIKQWLEFYIADRCAGTELFTHSIEGRDPVSDPLIINYDFESSHFARSVNGDYIILPGEIARFELADYFRTNERFQDINLQFKSTRKIHLKIKIPEGWHIKESSKPETIRSDFGISTSINQFKNGILIVDIEYLFTEDQIPALEYHKYQEFLDQISIRDLDEIVISKARSGK